MLREDIVSLKLNNIDYQNNTIRFNNKIFEFPEAFIERIIKYVENIRDENFRSNFFFARHYKGYSELPLAINSVNVIINKASDYLQKGGYRKIQINPEKLKVMLIKELFNSGFSLEQILLIADISLNTLSNYLDYDNIIERINGIKDLKEKHPYLLFYK